ncbi:MAG: hypothetical protein HPY79_12325 [Bacteroidales bacterium]|nr:hypothetical protein [Bacteroidales bacterium]
MKRKLLTVVLIFMVTSISSQIDTLFFYSTIDTNKLNDYINKKNINLHSKAWIYNFYKYNYYIIRRNHIEGNKILKYLINHSNSINSKYYLDHIKFYKLWLFTLYDNVDSVNYYLYSIINSKDISNRLKVRTLNTASFYFVRKNLSKSAKLLYKAIDIGLNDSLPELYHTFLNLSAIYLNLNLISKAEEYLSIGMKFKKINPNPILDYLYKHNENVILYTKMEYNKAIINFTDIYNFMKKYNLNEYLIGSAINISRAYFYSNKFDSSYSYAINILPIIKKDTLIKNREYLSSYYWLLSDLYINKKKIDSAIFYLTQTLNEASVTMLPDIYKDFSIIYFNENNKDSAYYFARLAYESQNKILDTLKTTIVNEYANKIDLLTIALNNKNLELKLIKSEQDKKNIKEIIIYLSIIFLFVTSLIILLLRYIHIKKVHNLKELFTQELTKYQEKLNQQISMELHDHIGQSLILLSRNKNIIEIPELQESIKDIINELRQISHQVFPTYLINNNFEEALNKLIYETEKNSQFVIIKEIDKNINNMPQEKALHVYRIIQELLSNSIKYCNGNLIYIKINTNNDNFTLLYKDVSNNIEHKKIIAGFGINSIHIRTIILNGTLEYWFNKGFNIKIIF